MTEWTVLVWTFLVFGAMVAMTIYRKKENDMSTNFSWKNYTKPTPKNLLGLSAAMRRLVLLVTGSSIIMDANKWVPLGVLLLGGFLDEAKNFFATVVEESKTESVTAEFPSGEEVTVTHEKPKEDGE